jgi:hypothetical protein
MIEYVLISIYLRWYCLDIDNNYDERCAGVDRFVNSLPRSLIIGDFGCGEAKLAQSVKHKVHSFDLVAPNKHVVACDIANVCHVG